MVQWLPWCQSRTLPITSPTPLLLPRASVDMVQFFFFSFLRGPPPQLFSPITFLDFHSVWLLVIWSLVVVVLMGLHCCCFFSPSSHWRAIILIQCYQPRPRLFRMYFQVLCEWHWSRHFNPELPEWGRGHLALGDKWSSSPYMFYFTGKFN